MCLHLVMQHKKDSFQLVQKIFSLCIKFLMSLQDLQWSSVCGYSVFVNSRTISKSVFREWILEIFKMLSCPEAVGPFVTPQMTGSLCMSLAGTHQYHGTW